MSCGIHVAVEVRGPPESLDTVVSQQLGGQPGVGDVEAHKHRCGDSGVGET